MQYVLDYEIVSIFFGIALAVVLNISGGRPSRSRRIFSFVIYLMTAGCIIDVISGYVRSRPSGFSTMTALVLINTGQLLSVLTAFAFAVYVGASTDIPLEAFPRDPGTDDVSHDVTRDDDRDPDRTVRSYERIMLAVFGVYLVLHVISVFSGHNVYIDASGSVTSGILEPVFSFAVPAAFVIGAGIFFVLKRHLFEKQQIHAMLMTLAFATVLFLYQAFFGRHILMSYMIGLVSIYVVFFALETPSVRLLTLNEMKLRKQAEAAGEAESRAMGTDEETIRFLTDTSFALRTPMTTMLGADEAILLRSGNGKVISYANDIRNALDMMLFTVEDLVDLGRLQMSDMKLMNEVYHLGDLLYNVSSMIRLTIREKHISYAEKFDPSLPDLLTGDMSRIQQVLLNILSYAASISDSGMVCLYAGRAPDGGGMTYTEDKTAVTLRFTVRCGGTDDILKEAGKLNCLHFDPEKDPGTGGEETDLGLVLSKNYTYLMGGSINVTGEKDGAVAFNVDIPQEVFYTEKGTLGEYIKNRKSLERSGIDPKRRQRIYAPGKRMLVVDDTAANRIVLRAMLNDSGVRVDEARDGAEALKMTADTDYDLVLLDEMMPDIDGHEVFLRLKERVSSGYRMPVMVAFTANAVKGVRDSFMDMGYDAYLSKPVSRDALEAVIERFVVNGNIRRAAV